MDEEECECEEGAPAWMATFSDLATLLLTFFVLLLSFAELDVVEFKELLGSVREAFGVQFRTHGHYEALSNSPVSLGDAPPGALTYISDAEVTEAIREALERAGVEQSVDVQATPDGIVVRIRDQVLFPTGSAQLQEDAGPVLEVIANLAAEMGEQGIAIEGHTDDRPIHTSRFPSNWELSTSRATQVLRYLLANTELSPAQVSASGYADTRPIAPNDNADNRGLNRRVEFLFKRPAPPEDDERPDRIVQPRNPTRLMPQAREPLTGANAEPTSAERAAADAEAEADAEADAEAEADADAEAEAEAETDAEAQAGADADPVSDSNTESGTN